MFVDGSGHIESNTGKSNKQFTVYKFSIFNKHANPNNQPYYYIITFTQYTKHFFDWHEGEITHIVYMIVC
jgi:hypothetical protein